MNADGVLKAVKVPMAIAVGSDALQLFEKQLAGLIATSPKLKVQCAHGPGAQLWYVNTGDHFEDGTAFATFTPTVSVAMTRIMQTRSVSIEWFTVDALTGIPHFKLPGSALDIVGQKRRRTNHVGPQQRTLDKSHGFSTYFGYYSNINLFRARASVFDMNLGLGVETHDGLSDGSVKTHLAGCSITVGRPVRVSSFGNSFALDFEGFFG